MRKLSSILSVAIATVAIQAEAGNLIRFTRATVDPQQMTTKSNPKTSEMIVQFKDAIQESDKKYLNSLGLEILGYLPDDALVVTGDFSKIEKNNPRINSVTPYLPEFKISAAITSITTNANKPELWVVSTFTKKQLPQVAKAIRGNQNLRVLSEGSKSVLVYAYRSQLKSLASLPGVEHVQANPEFESLHMKSLDMDGQFSTMENEPLAGTETGTKVMKFEAAWNRGFTGKGQIVSFADTGLDVGDSAKIHPDFSGSIKAGQALGLFGKSWEDPMGHGTHVAGSIAGRGTNSNGALKGGAYEAMFVAQSMWSSMMNNIMPPSRIETLFNNANKEGATVHTNSWGSPKALGEYDSYAQQVDEWLFNNQDFVVLFAAGNSGVDQNKDGRIDSGSIGSPATAKNAISVGASENTTTTGGIQVPISKLRTGPESWGAEPIFSSMISDNANGVAMFSSRGPTRDGRIKPDVVAPGTNILSTKSMHPSAQLLWGKYNDHYVWSGGTSMSTPLVAGAVVVARQYVQEKLGIQKPSAALMKAVMHHNAVDMFPGQYGQGSATQELQTRRPNSDEGYGRVDMDVITSMGPNTKIADEKAGVAVNEEKVYSFTVPNNGSLLANMVYTDAPASANAAKALVNDIDLILVKTDGSQVASMDRVNNHEVIELSGLAAGNYKLIVKGINIPKGLGGRQPFALIYSVK